MTTSIYLACGNVWSGNGNHGALWADDPDIGGSDTTSFTINSPIGSTDRAVWGYLPALDPVYVPLVESVWLEAHAGVYQDDRGTGDVGLAEFNIGFTLGESPSMANGDYIDAIGVFNDPTLPTGTFSDGMIQQQLTNWGYGGPSVPSTQEEFLNRLAGLEPTSPAPTYVRNIYFTALETPLAPLGSGAARTVTVWAARLRLDLLPTATPPLPIPPLRLTNRDDVRLIGQRSQQGSNRITGYL